MHSADHRHHREPPVPRHAAPLHLQRPRVHPGLLHHQQAVSGGAQAHLPTDFGHQGERGGHPNHAGGQQERRDPAGGGDQGRGGPVQTVEVRLHGDLCQDQPQRHRAVPGAAQPRQEEEHEPQHRWETLRKAVPRRETEGEVHRDVSMCPGGGIAGTTAGSSITKHF